MNLYQASNPFIKDARSVQLAHPAQGGGGVKSLKNIFKLVSLVMAAVCLSTCTSSAPSTSNVRSEPPRGFFDSLGDHLTERECNVVKFTCPYGFGPAGEPCDCTEPSGIVRQGRTIK
jgi:hypothetical protein